MGPLPRDVVAEDGRDTSKRLIFAHRIPDLDGGYQSPSAGAKSQVNSVILVAGGIYLTGPESRPR